MNLTTDQLSVRVEHQLKVDAEAILNKLGLKTSDAIRMFLKQICLTQSVPFEIKLPNKIDTALAEIENGEFDTLTLDEFKKELKGLK